MWKSPLETLQQIQLICKIFQPFLVMSYRNRTHIYGNDTHLSNKTTHNKETTTDICTHKTFLTEDNSLTILWQKASLFQPVSFLSQNKFH